MALSRARALSVLGLSHDKIAVADIRAAFKRMALATHPDKGGTAQTFDEVMLAFQVLSGMPLKSQGCSVSQQVDSRCGRKPGVCSAKRRRRATSSRLRQKSDPARLGATSSSQQSSDCHERCSARCKSENGEQVLNADQLAVASGQGMELALYSETDSEDDVAEDNVCALIPRRGRVGMARLSRRSASGMEGIYKCGKRYHCKLLSRYLGISAPVRETLELAIQDHIILTEIAFRHELHWSSLRELQSVDCLYDLLNSNVQGALLSFDVGAAAQHFSFHWRSQKKFERGISLLVMSPLTRSLRALAENFLKLRPCEPIRHWESFCREYSAMRGDGQCGAESVRKLEAILRRKVMLREAKQSRKTTRWPTIRPWEQRFKDLKSWLEQHQNAYPRPRHADLWEYDLARWVTRQREAKRFGSMRPERSFLLEQLPNWFWQKMAPRSGWDKQFERLEAWVVHSNGRYPSRSSKDNEERAIASWIHNQHVAKDGTLGRRLISKEQVERLEGLPGWRWPSKRPNASPHEHQQLLCLEPPQGLSGHRPLRRLRRVSISKLAQQPVE